MCTKLFRAAVFVKAPNWKQPRCSLTGEVFLNYRISYNGVLLSNKKERTLIQATWWMNLKNTVKQKKPDAIEYQINVWFPLYGISRAGRTHLWWWKLEHWAPVGTDWKGSQESFWDGGNVLCSGWWDGHVGVDIDRSHLPQWRPNTAK